MPVFDTNHWAILLLVLVLGWLLGLASRSGGAKWRRAYERERSDNLAVRAAHEAELVQARTRIAELESTASRAPATLVVPDGQDDLSLIRGVGRDGAPRLNAVGVNSYRDLAQLTAADETALESRIGLDPGVIARERWREQAELLAAGRHDDHRRMFS